MHDIYENPLSTRYASREMLELFSDDKKFKTWRKLWLTLASCEKELGLNITEEQIKDLEDNLENIDYDKVKEYELKLRHDVMSHVHAYGDVAKSAMPIIHLGATSCFVTDNTDLIIYKEALNIIKQRVLLVIKNLKDFALKYKNLPTLGFTHMQPAQLVTVGKRATLWINELLIDLDSINHIIDTIPFRSTKGTTGTQATFLELFEGNHEKVKQLEKMVAEKMGFKDKILPVSGQTYTRKYDYNILSVLSEVAQSAYKAGNDIRILQSLKEIEEPFEKTQIGSSAMAYKRNPMRSERMCSLARFVISAPINAAVTSSTQWFERTLDDSANKRIVLSEAFLALDAVLLIYANITSNLVVYQNMIKKHVMDELPFMATEIILMECVKAGGDRQELHERIRVLSMEAAKEVKEYGRMNDLVERILKDDSFKAIHSKLNDILNPKNFIGRADKQVDEFICQYVDPVLKDLDKKLKTETLKV